MTITRIMPDARSTLLEFTAPAELASVFLSLPRLVSQPRGRGETIIVFPGFGGGDGSTALMRRYLRFLGYRVDGWGLGTNRGNVPQLLARLTSAVRARYQQDGSPVRLLGWSLGGYLAREVARELPEAVDRVVTLGSPVVGGPRYTLTAPIYRLVGADFDAIDREIRRREQVPLKVPVTAIYSRRDGIVNWEACIDHSSRCVDHVEVDASHIGMGSNPEVLAIIAQRMQ